MLKKFCSDTSAVPGRRIISFSIVAPGKVRSNFLSNRMRLLDLATRVMYLSLPWPDHIVVDADRDYVRWSYPQDLWLEIRHDLFAPL
jgi:hypothetical protein